MKLKERVAARIKVLRRCRGLTQGELAEMIERTVDAVFALERGRSLPSFDTLERLSRVLDVPAREFFDEDGRERGNAKRAALMATLIDCARSLSDVDLEVAAQQVQVLARHPARLRGKR